jgi:hypothetical protein
MTSDERTRRNREHEGDASLEGLRGTGGLVVLRHPDGKLDSVVGWFEPSDPNADLSELAKAQQEDLGVEYDGPIVDPEQDRRRTRRTRVVITKIAKAPDRAGVDEPTDGPWIEFEAGDVLDGEVSTQESRLE